MNAADIAARLDDLRCRPKYLDEPGTLYNGMRPRSQRQQAEAQLNDLIGNLRRRLPEIPSKGVVLDEFSNA
jgi:hypothetical protein